VTTVSNTPYTVNIAGRRLQIAGDSGLAAVGPAFAGVVDHGSVPAHATLEIETASDPAGGDPWRNCEIGAYRHPDGSLAVVSRAPSSVETFLPGAVPRLGLTASPEALASGDLRSQPANRAIASWLASETVQLVHGAAVAVDGRGVLLVGIGGRGKTTTAIACAQAGFSYLGDDLCVVETGSAEEGLPVRVHGVYATAKLNRDSRQRLGVRDWTVLGITSKGKDAVAIPPEVRFERSVPLVAIVGVRAGSDSAGIVRRASSSAAIGILSATALPVRVGSGKATFWLRTAASIARQVPAYELGLDWDLDRVTAAVRAIVERSYEERPATEEPTVVRPPRR
jgi:hypothetical protein